MSNIGKKSIDVPDGVDISLNKNMISIKGSLGELSLEFNFYQILYKKMV